MLSFLLFEYYKSQVQADFNTATNYWAVTSIMVGFFMVGEYLSAVSKLIVTKDEEQLPIKRNKNFFFKPSNLRLTGNVKTDIEFRKNDFRRYFTRHLALPIILFFVFGASWYVYRRIINPQLYFSDPPLHDFTSNTLIFFVAVSVILILLGCVKAISKYKTVPSFVIPKNDNIEPPEMNQARKKNSITKTMKSNFKFKLFSLSLFSMLVLTNPGVNRFKEFLGETNMQDLRRKQNWLIFSVYSDGYSRYIGIFLNFLEIGDEENN